MYGYTVYLLSVSAYWEREGGGGEGGGSKMEEGWGLSWEGCAVTRSDKERGVGLDWVGVKRGSTPPTIHTLANLISILPDRVTVQLLTSVPFYKTDFRRWAF